MFKKQIDDNIETLDLRIGTLTHELGSIEKDDIVEFERITKKLDKLVELRIKLSDSQTKASKFPMIFSGALQVSSILLILYYEKADAITSKGFNLALNGFKKGV